MVSVRRNVLGVCPELDRALLSDNPTHDKSGETETAMAIPRDIERCFDSDELVAANLVLSRSASPTISKNLVRGHGYEEWFSIQYE